MDESVKHSSRPIPVLIGYDYKHVMARAEIFRSSDKVLIQIISEDGNGKTLAGLLEQDEPVALIFGAVPVRNTREKRDTN